MTRSDSARAVTLIAFLALAAGLVLVRPVASGQEDSGLAGAGASHFRISFQGGTGDPDFDAFDPDVAYNPIANEYLVVWEGTNDICGGVGSPDREIFAQRVDAATGSPIDSPISVSQMDPPDCSPPHRALDPAVAYNATEDEYLIVFEGDQDELGGVVSGEFEIWGQRVSGDLGDPVGMDDFRISDMGGTGDQDFDARDPAVVWNATENEYMVVWSGEDNIGGLIDGETEIFGQRLDETGTEQGANDFRISDVGGTGDAIYGAIEPDVAWNANENEYLVVWWGDDNVGGIVDNETEVFGQRLDGTGAEQGVNDFPISFVGGAADIGILTRLPDVAHNPTANEYLVVWQEVIEICSPQLDEEDFARRIDGTNGAQLGSQISVSQMSPSGCEPAYAAGGPAAVYNAIADEYLIVWTGDQEVPGGVVNDEFEIWGQRLTGDEGDPVGDDDFRISDMGGTGDTSFSASFSALAWSDATGENLAVWAGTDNVGGLVQGEFEIFGEYALSPARSRGWRSVASRQIAAP